MFFLRFPFFSSIFLFFPTPLHFFTCFTSRCLARDIMGDLGVFDHGAWGDSQPMVLGG